MTKTHREVLRWIALVCLVGPTGCFFHEKTIGTDTIVQSETSSSERVTTVVTDGKKAFYCAEPSPDSTSQLTASIDSTTKLASDASEDAKIEFATQVVQLAGRTEVVLLVRESLYRLCEAAANGLVDKTLYEKSYTDLIGEMSKLIEAEQKAAQASADNAEAKKTKAAAGKKALDTVIDQQKAAGKNVDLKELRNNYQEFFH